MSQAIRKQVVIRNRYGLHARPAALFVELCNKFTSQIQVEKDGASANGKNILDIMMLGAQSGCELTLVCAGDDAPAAADALVALVESNFHENDN